MSSTSSQTAPNGFLLCDGKKYRRIDYPDLYAALGYQALPLLSDFNVPDLRDKFVIGANEGLNIRTTGGYDSMGAPTGPQLNDCHAISGVEQYPVVCTVASGGFQRGHVGATAIGSMPVVPYGSYAIGPADLYSHSHSVTMPPHAHTITDPGHVHTVPDHTHGIPDCATFVNSNGYGVGSPAAHYIVNTGDQSTMGVNSPIVTATGSTGIVVDSQVLVGTSTVFPTTQTAFSIMPPNYGLFYIIKSLNITSSLSTSTGTAKIVSAASSIVVLNALVRSTSIIMVNLSGGFDATAIRFTVSTIVPGTSFTITANTAATLDVNLNWAILS